MLRSTLRKHFLTPNTIRYRIEFRCLLDAAKKIPNLNGVLLDAGAGSGEMSKKLFESGFGSKLIGVEPFDSNYKELVKNYKGVPNAEPIHASLDHVPLEDNSVDVVMTTQVFEHIEDHESAAKELDRILKKGGYILFSVPHPPEIFPNDGHVRPGYTVEEVQDLWDPLGFELVSHEYFFTLPTLRRVVAAHEMPFKGRYFPIKWADKESGLSNEEKFQQQPYGILCLLRKVS